MLLGVVSRIKIIVSGFYCSLDMATQLAAISAIAALVTKSTIIVEKEDV